MKLDAVDFYKYLQKEGVTNLYHANTVCTSCSFLDTGGLLSRGAIEYRKLLQTPQSSDDIDKKFNVWNDIFLDTKDLHDQFDNMNFYGPVLFKFKLEVLLCPNLPSIWVTKDNPIRWNTGTDDQHYFKNISELESDTTYPFFQRMITLRNTLSPLPFSSYLEEILLDDPHRDSYFDEAQKTLEACLKRNKYDATILKVRKCWSGCKCSTKYNTYPTKTLRQLFL